MARWTDLAEWRGHAAGNSGDGDGVPLEAADRMYEYRGLVVHIAAGYYEGTISWQKNNTSDVSSHFVVAGPRDVALGTKDGKLAQVVDTADRAWTQGDGNGHWLSIECSGFLPDRLSAAQIESIAQILARAHREYGVPLQVCASPSGRGLGHHSMGAENGYDWGHDQCPGSNIIAQKPQIVARAKEIVEGAMQLSHPHDDWLAMCDARGRDVAAWKDEITATIDGKERVEPNVFKQEFDALAAKVDEILALLSEGVTVPAQVSLTPESVQEVAEAVADEDHARSAQ